MEESEVCLECYQEECDRLDKLEKKYKARQLKFLGREDRRKGL